MSTVNTGGPAFPMPLDAATEYASAFDDLANVNLDGSERVYLEAKRQALQGMTLRDYFAAKAMDGFNREMVAFEWGEDVTAHAAKRAYEIADAMLKARETE